MSSRFSNAETEFLRGQDNGPNVAVARTVRFNLDNGAGTTADDVPIRAGVAIVIRAARILYAEEVAGVVAGANARVGLTLGGSEIVAATAYENGSVPGAVTPMVVLAGGAVPAGAPVFVRHTGVAAVALGQAIVELEYVEA